MGDVIELGERARAMAAQQDAGRVASPPRIDVRRVLSFYLVAGDRAGAAEAALSIARAYRKRGAVAEALAVLADARAELVERTELDVYAAALAGDATVRHRCTERCRKRLRLRSAPPLVPADPAQLRDALREDVVRGMNDRSRLRREVCAMVEAFLTAGNVDGAADAVVTIAEAVAERDARGGSLAAFMVLSYAPSAIAGAPAITARQVQYLDAARRRYRLSLAQ